MRSLPLKKDRHCADRRRVHTSIQFTTYGERRFRLEKQNPTLFPRASRRYRSASACVVMRDNLAHSSSLTIKAKTQTAAPDF